MPGRLHWYARQPGKSAIKAALVGRVRPIPEVHRAACPFTEQLGHKLAESIMQEYEVLAIHEVDALFNKQLKVLIIQG